MARWKRGVTEIAGLECVGRFYADVGEIWRDAGHDGSEGAVGNRSELKAGARCAPYRDKWLVGKESLSGQWGLGHCTPLECRALDMYCAIDIALRWSATIRTNLVSIDISLLRRGESRPGGDLYRSHYSFL